MQLSYEQLFETSAPLELRKKSALEMLGLAKKAHAAIQKCEAGAKYSAKDYASACMHFLMCMMHYSMKDEFRGVESVELIEPLNHPPFGIKLHFENTTETLVRPIWTGPKEEGGYNLPNVKGIQAAINRAFPRSYLSKSVCETTVGSCVYHVTIRDKYLPKDHGFAAEGTAICSILPVAYMQAAVRMLHNWLNNRLVMLADEKWKDDKLKDLMQSKAPWDWDRAKAFRERYYDAYGIPRWARVQSVKDANDFRRTQQQIKADLVRRMALRRRYIADHVERRQQAYLNTKGAQYGVKEKWDGKTDLFQEETKGPIDKIARGLKASVQDEHGTLHKADAPPKPAMPPELRQQLMMVFGEELLAEATYEIGPDGVPIVSIGFDKS